MGIVRTGSPWRYIPNDLPPWEAVYQQAIRWIAAGVFEAMVHDLRELLRMAEGRDTKGPGACSRFFAAGDWGGMVATGHLFGDDGWTKEVGIVRTGIRMTVCLAIGVALLVGCSTNRASKDSTAILHAEYTKCKTEKDRLLFTLALMDRGVIDYGIPMSKATSIFGDDLKDAGNPNGNTAVILHFAQQYHQREDHPTEASSDSPRLHMSLPVSGWYLVLTYNGSGTVIDYYVSNVHRWNPRHGWDAAGL